jgi:hypothetical protein
LLYYLSTRVQGGYATSGASLAFHWCPGLIDTQSTPVF